MSVSRRDRRIGFSIIGFLVAVMALAAVWPKPAYSERVLEKIGCVAAAVALHQHLFDRFEAGLPAPDFLREFEGRHSRLLAYTRSLNRSGDRHAHAIRPVMIEAETARDAAVDIDSDAYVFEAWTNLQACQDRLFAAPA
ncbi:hypothetical protein [Roseisalinus antarcticus]|uniref:Uncharacterized protein n=1 Tax=Roseisalinus antarcticus TaxID=254357 RepID=A0A1Y5RQM7_9RHOB|nr:hypothetical protein [Roseisalinus antarcticus]SLN23003.1 hypothetical protein ROA7023_00677 [Roseisalinus antarcticus]